MKLRRRAPERRQDKLWSPGFIILWQSRLVSTAGDAVYGIASAVNIRAKDKFRLFAAASFLFYTLLIILINQPYFIVMAVLMAASGALNAAFNVVLISTIQIATPEGVRGKVCHLSLWRQAGSRPWRWPPQACWGKFCPSGPSCPRRMP